MERNLSFSDIFSDTVSEKDKRETAIAIWKSVLIPGRLQTAYTLS